jgi:serine/threonine protein kinase
MDKKWVPIGSRNPFYGTKENALSELDKLKEAVDAASGGGNKKLYLNGAGELNTHQGHMSRGQKFRELFTGRYARQKQDARNEIFVQLIDIRNNFETSAEAAHTKSGNRDLSYKSVRKALISDIATKLDKEIAGTEIKTGDDVIKLINRIKYAIADGLEGQQDGPSLASRLNAFVRLNPSELRAHEIADNAGNKSHRSDYKRDTFTENDHLKKKLRAKAIDKKADVGGLGHNVPAIPAGPAVPVVPVVLAVPVVPVLRGTAQPAPNPPALPIKVAPAASALIKDESQKFGDFLSGMNDCIDRIEKLPLNGKQKWDALRDFRHQTYPEMGNGMDPSGDALQIGTATYVRGIELGKGGYGTVFRFSDVTDPSRRVAIKFPNAPPKLFGDKYDNFCGSIKEARLNYIAQGATLSLDRNAVGREKHINPIIGAIIDNSGIFLPIFEEAPYGDLHDFFQNLLTAHDHGMFSMDIPGGDIDAQSQKFLEALYATILRDVLKSLRSVHEKKITHYDMKPENMIIDSTGAATMIDFGLSQHAGPGNDIRVNLGEGTPDYMNTADDDFLIKGAATILRDSYSVGRIIEHRFDLLEDASGNVAVAGDVAEIKSLLLNDIRSRATPTKILSDRNRFRQSIFKKNGVGGELIRDAIIAITKYDGSPESQTSLQIEMMRYEVQERNHRSNPVKYPWKRTPSLPTNSTAVDSRRSGI